MKTIKETIKLEVTVNIEYFNKPTVKERKLAIKKAKHCVLSQSIFSLTSIKPKKAKLIL